MAERVLVAAIFLGFGIIAYREMQLGQFPPRPSRFLGLALVASVLAVLALASMPLAAAFAVAVDVGIGFGLVGGPGPLSAEARRVNA